MFELLKSLAKLLFCEPAKFDRKSAQLSHRACGVITDLVQIRDQETYEVTLVPILASAEGGLGWSQTLVRYPECFEVAESLSGLSIPSVLQ